MRGEFFIAAAMLVAVATGWGTYTYLEQLVETEVVVVPRSDLPAHTRLQAGDVAVEPRPAAGLHPNALTDTDDAVGRFLVRPVTAGQVLLHSDLLPPDGLPGQLGRLEPLERAVRVAAEDLAGLGPQLAPGSRVDLIFVGGMQQDGLARTLLQGVEILEVERQEARSGDERIEAVVFRLDLPEAERLAFGLHRGTLRLVVNGYRARPALTPGVREGDLFDMPVVDGTPPPLIDWPPIEEAW